MPKSISLTGQAGKTYNLDELTENNLRVDSEKELLVQIWMWNPKIKGEHGFSNPKNPKIGQIWLSKLIDENSEEYKQLEATAVEGDE